HPTKPGTVTVAGRRCIRRSWLPSGNSPNWGNRDMRYWVRIYRQGKDYSALVPDLPGCVAAGDSVEDIRKQITDAITMHLEMMEQTGEKVPAPTQHVDLDLTELEEGELSTWVDVPLPHAKRHTR